MKQLDTEINILVVDDDNLVLDVIAEYLEYFGLCNLKLITRPQKALQYIQDSSNKIDLILSDWEMQHLSGLELLKAVRGNKERFDTKFIMITSQGSLERLKITKAVQYSVSEYIIKPFRAEVLRDKICKVFKWEEYSEEEEAS